MLRCRYASGPSDSKMVRRQRADWPLVRRRVHHSRTRPFPASSPRRVGLRRTLPNFRPGSAPAAVEPGRVREQVYQIRTRSSGQRRAPSPKRQASKPRSNTRRNGLRLVRARDNGRGIDPEDLLVVGEGCALGLARECSIGPEAKIRAQLRIWSRPGAGTEVEISVPGPVVADACA